MVRASFENYELEISIHNTKDQQDFLDKSILGLHK